MNIENIVSAAIGSIMTIIITKLLELWQRKIDHNYQLKKTFFEKKVIAAEHAVSLWYTTSISLSSLSALYEKAIEKPGEGNATLFESLNNAYFSQMNKLTESASNLSNAIYLYFDFESDTAKAKEPLKALFHALSEIKNLSISADALKQVKDYSPNDITTKEFVLSEERMIRDSAVQHLNQIKLLFDDAQQELHGMLKVVRTEMKKFDK